MVSQMASSLRGTRARIHVCIPSVSVHFVFESCLSRVVHAQLKADVFPACRSTACRSTGATSYKPSTLTSPILSRVLGFAGTSRGTPAWRRVDGVTDVLLMPVIPSVCVSKLSVQAQSGSLSSMQGHGSEVAGTSRGTPAWRRVDGVADGKLFARYPCAHTRVDSQCLCALCRCTLSVHSGCFHTG